MAELDEIWTSVLAALPDNWGRWGDELGPLNYLGSAEVFEGLKIEHGAGTLVNPVAVKATQ